MGILSLRFLNSEIGITPKGRIFKKNYFIVFFPLRYKIIFVIVYAIAVPDFSPFPISTQPTHRIIVRIKINEIMYMPGTQKVPSKWFCNYYCYLRIIIWVRRDYVWEVSDIVTWVILSTG